MLRTHTELQWHSFYERFFGNFPLCVSFGECTCGLFEIPIRLFQTPVQIETERIRKVNPIVQRLSNERITLVLATYNLLHSRFIWLPLAISCIIRNLVESSRDVGAASALVGVGTIGAWTGPVVTGTGAIGLNAVFSWAIVKLFMCSMSLIMQKPPPIFFVMTRER